MSGTVISTYLSSLTTATATVLKNNGPCPLLIDVSDNRNNVEKNIHQWLIQIAIVY